MGWVDTRHILLQVDADNKQMRGIATKESGDDGERGAAAAAVDDKQLCLSMGGTRIGGFATDEAETCGQRLKRIRRQGT